MTKKGVYLIVLFGAALAFTYGYPYGAPDEACKTLKPNHGYGIFPRTDWSPYSIEVDDMYYRQGESIKGKEGSG